jgi:hypothetical protein
MLEFLVLHTNKNNISIFPNLQSIIQERTWEAELKQNILDHLATLQHNFDRYFPDDGTSDRWVLNPFGYEIANLPDSINFIAQEEFVRLSGSIVEESKFDKNNICYSWWKLGEHFPNLSDKALRILTQFPTTYLCEKGFSHMLFLKNDYRNRLEVENDLRVNLSTIKPRFVS